MAVFVEGGRKGVIKLPEGCRGWGWQRFVDELQILVAHLVEKALPVVPIVNAGEVGRLQSFADPTINAGEVVCASRSKLSVMESQVSMSDLGSNLRSQWPLPDCALVVMRS